MTDEPNSAAQELLTFRLGEQEYALDIMSVREIRGWTHATPLPHAPAHMKGVINLRGTVLPVLDLGKRLGLADRDQNHRNVIIVVKTDEAMTGLLVDAVSDIITVAADDLQPPPDYSSAEGAQVVSGLTLFDDRMIRVLNLAATVTSGERSAA